MIDSEIASQFFMGRTKIRYMILKIFKSSMKEAFNSSIYYSLSFNESLNSVEQKCQMDVNVRFWNESRNIVKTKYYNSKCLDRPNAENLFESIGDRSNRLQFEKLLRLAINGPNVNWEVLKRLMETLFKNDYSKTINIGSCPQHTLLMVLLKLGLLMIGMFIKYLKTCSGYCIILLLIEIYM